MHRGGAAAGGEKYTSKEGQFAIAFPKGAEAKTHKNEKGRASLDAVLVESQGTLHGVAYGEVPAAELKNLGTFCDSVESGLVKRTGAKVTERKEVMFGPDKLPARDLLTERDGVHGRLVLVVNGTRIYAIMVRGSKEFVQLDGGSCVRRLLRVQIGAARLACRVLPFASSERQAEPGAAPDTAG